MGFSTIMTLSTDYRRKGEFHWNDRERKAFEEMNAKCQGTCLQPSEIFKSL